MKTPSRKPHRCPDERDISKQPKQGSQETEELKKNLPHRFPGHHITASLEVLNDCRLGLRSEGAGIVGNLIEREGKVQQEVGIVPGSAGSCGSGLGRHACVQLNGSVDRGWVGG